MTYTSGESDPNTGSQRRLPTRVWRFRSSQFAIGMAWLAGCTGAALPANASEVYAGEAQSKDGKLLYREQHWLYREHDADARLVVYACPDGKPFARKHIWYGIDRESPDFALEDVRDGFAEGVRSTARARQMFVRDTAAAPERTAPLQARADTVIDAGFDDFVHSHWAALARPAASLPLTFVVPARLSVLDFKVTTVGDEQSDGLPSRRYRLALSRWYGGFLPHIDVIYATSSRQLLAYEGVGNIRDGDGHNLDVRIHFPPQQRRNDVDEAAVAAAAAVPLTGSCKL